MVVMRAAVGADEPAYVFAAMTLRLADLEALVREEGSEGIEEFDVEKIVLRMTPEQQDRLDAALEVGRELEGSSPRINTFGIRAPLHPASRRCDSSNTGRGRLLVAPGDAGASGLSVLRIYFCAVPKDRRRGGSGEARGTRQRRRGRRVGDRRTKWLDRADPDEDHGSRSKQLRVCMHSGT
jgi:hypothetical protein